jgi:hypothetical protein
MQGEVDEAARFRESLTRLNIALGRAGLGQHIEPETLATGTDFSRSMWGYSGLHYLRRSAAYMAKTRF